ncbi:MAG: hypothetical protein ACLFUJ_06880 [Phycisphaerae bacterium]
MNDRELLETLSGVQQLMQWQKRLVDECVQVLQARLKTSPNLPPSAQDGTEPHERDL